MNSQLPTSWLNDGTLSSIAGQGSSDPSMWARRYDADCPSEFYRGYATIFAQVSEAFRSNPTLAALRQMIDTLYLETNDLPSDERKDGAAFALVNIASYAQGGTVPEVSTTLAAELVCIARCFVYNQARGL